MSKGYQAKLLQYRLNNKIKMGMGGGERAVRDNPINEPSKNRPRIGIDPPPLQEHALFASSVFPLDVFSFRFSFFLFMFVLLIFLF